MRISRIVCGLLVMGLSASAALAAELSAAAQGTAGARVNNLKVLSDKIDDVTTPENILKSFVKPGMTDAQRATALWNAAVKYRHQTIPPNEYLSGEWEAHDPVKIFNVYGYCMCCCASSLIESLNRLDGREARGRILNGHSVPEVKYDNAWHLYDCSLINYFPKPGTGELASVDDISQSIKDWYDQNPDYKGNPGKVFELMKSDGWMGWKEKGPALLANNPFYKMGYWPARTHGWDSTMSEYNRSAEIYEYGYEIGHRALFSLRPGESLVRESGNRGLHVNMEADPNFVMLTEKTPDGDLAYTKAFFPAYHGGVVANGIHRYAPDLASGGLAAGAETYENLASGGPLALHVKAPGKPGIAIVQMASPYVYLDGTIEVTAFRKSIADRVTIAVSTNNGRTFDPVWSAEKTGSCEAIIELKDRVLRRYAYQVKIEITSTSPGGAGLNSLVFQSNIQHAPRTVPFLGKGSNTITVAADADPALASRAIACRITGDPKFDKNETAATMGVTFDNLRVDEGCWWKGGVGTMTVPIDTPGDMTAIRFGAHIRARGEKDRVRMLLSFDAGKPWTEPAVIAGPTPAITRYFKTTAIPAGTRHALLRYELSGNNTIGVFTFRADADYKDPLAEKTFHPFLVTHRWKEDGRQKSRTVSVTKLPFTYTIQADADPEMVSVSYEMPAKP